MEIGKPKGILEGNYNLKYFQKDSIRQKKLHRSTYPILFNFIKNNLNLVYFIININH